MSSSVSIPASILQPLFLVSNSSTLDKSLENLIESARTTDGRFNLASKNILVTTLHLCQALSYLSCGGTLLLALKLVRNLCAGEPQNQNSFIEQNGVNIVSSIITSKGILNDTNYGIIRMGLQVLANVSLAGEEHQSVIWQRVFSLEFVDIARLRRRETCDPLCMIVYTCVDGNHRLIDKLCSDHALPLLVEFIRTAAIVGFGEDWLKLILSKTCIEESYFTSLFSKLSRAPSETKDDILPPIITQDQSFLLNLLSEILNEQIENIKVSKIFAFGIFQTLKTTLPVLNSISPPKSDIDALNYSLCILRDICACDAHMGIIDPLLSLGLLELLLDLLRELEPPLIIRKSLNPDETRDKLLCPYLGFRSDIVAVIGNCAYRRSRVQNEIREKNGILLMLQQCVTDDGNPFLREWGIWAVRNLLEGNVENQRLVNELEVQGSVDLPELSRLGLRVEVDQETRHAKLVNTGAT